MSEKKVQVGDVIQQGLKKDWVVVALTDRGIVKLLEPVESVIRDPIAFAFLERIGGQVEFLKDVGNNDSAIMHRHFLRAQGHVNARLWTENDRADIEEHIIKGGHNSKARLDSSGLCAVRGPSSQYWGEEAEESSYIDGICGLYWGEATTDEGIVLYSLEDDQPFAAYIDGSNAARIRCIEEVSLENLSTLEV